MTTTIVKWGNSRGIRLPKYLLDMVGLSDNDNVEVLAQNDGIIIKKSESKRPHKTIEELFKDFHGEYEASEIDWGGPVGNEIW